MTPSAAARRQPASSRPQELLQELTAFRDEATRRTFVARNPALRRTAFVVKLADQAREQIRVDVEQAARLADASLAIAEQLGDEESKAWALRALANVSFAKGDNTAAVEFHQRAAHLFQQAGNTHELARGLSGSIQPLLLLGKYEEAFSAAKRARKAFIREKDTLRLARLEINVGNIYFRQDRFSEALACYQRARRNLSKKQDSEAVAAVLSNIATCQISLNNFAESLRTYQAARRFCAGHGMPLLAAQADYNIAYLYYHRGQYGRAIELLQQARRKAQKIGDQYHHSLCNLDLAELYVELNLSSQAADLAQQGYEGFRKLGIGYEAGKCLAFAAMASGQMGDAEKALQLFSQAREMFVREGNPAWPSLIDLYRALLSYQKEDFPSARSLCTEAFNSLERLSLAGKAALAQLLLGRIALREDNLAQALQCARIVLQKLARLELPNLDFQAHLLMGDIASSTGDLQQAYGSYLSARAAFETLRSTLRRDELKISFVKNRLEVYERLVELCLQRNSPAAREEAFAYIEQAKSRSLMELFAQPMLSTLDADGQTELAHSIRDLREELNGYYNRLEKEQLDPQAGSAQRIASLQGQISERENKLVHMMQETATASGGESQSSAQPSLAAVRAALPKKSLIVEYFEIRGNLFACVVGHEIFEIVPISPAEKIAGILRLLQFQLAKFRLDPGYVKAFHNLLLRTAQAHLRELYAELMAPVARHFKAEHLVVVPHGVLHYVPFHALYDGDHPLIERQTISYAPSAGIYALCQQRPAPTGGPSLVLGVPDSRAPAIQDEVEALRNILPRAQLFVGKKATAEVLRRKGAGSRMIHIATHGYFRQDNPMFSSIRLGGSFLNLYDLYQLSLPAELITLSGCSTGLNVVAAGDELLGLVRGLLHAGAQSLLLSLWDVHDESTAKFMKAFYRLLRKGWSKPVALRQAMLDLRSSYPHPYQWAPFMLVGKG